MPDLGYNTCMTTFVQKEIPKEALVSSTSLFAIIVELQWGDELRRIRSSFRTDKTAAIEYAERNRGVVAVEEIGVGIVWERNRG